MFIFQKFDFFRTPTPKPLGESFRENLLIKSGNQNIFEKFKLNRDLQTIPLRIIYNMSMLRHRFSNERWGGGGTLISYSIKVCTKILIDQSINQSTFY